MSLTNRSFLGVSIGIAVLALGSHTIPSFSKPIDPPPAVETLEMYEIDNGHSSVVFAVNHFGLSYIYGRFNQVSGDFSLLGRDPTEHGFKFIIASETVDTNNADRDEHLRSPDFFNCQQFPTIQFTTIRWEKQDDEFLVTGELELLGNTKIITLPIRLIGKGTDPFGKRRAGFFTKFTIKRSDYGMDKMIGSIGDNVAITFSFEGILKDE